MPPRTHATPNQSPDLVRHLDALNRGDADALMLLIAEAYPRLRAIAAWRIARSATGGSDRHGLEPSALVHEVHIRLTQIQVEWRDPHHFFATASAIMKGMITDRRRAQTRIKRGGPVARESFDERVHRGGAAQERGDVHDALNALEGHDPRHADIVRLRYMCGLSVDECAAYLGVSPRTVERGWQAARRWLRRELDTAQA